LDETVLFEKLFEFSQDNEITSNAKGSSLKRNRNDSFLIYSSPHNILPYLII
jgi:hypothetical protein